MILVRSWRLPWSQKVIKICKCVSGRGETMVMTVQSKTMESVPPLPKKRQQTQEHMPQSIVCVCCNVYSDNPSSRRTTVHIMIRAGRRGGLSVVHGIHSGTFNNLWQQVKCSLPPSSPVFMSHPLCSYLMQWGP